MKIFIEELFSEEDLYGGIYRDCKFVRTNIYECEAAIGCVFEDSYLRATEPGELGIGEHPIPHIATDYPALLHQVRAQNAELRDKLEAVQMAKPLKFIGSIIYDNTGKPEAKTAAQPAEGGR